MPFLSTSLLVRAFVIVSVAALSVGLSGCALEGEEEETGEVELEAKGGKNKKGRRFEVLAHNIGGSAENDGGEAGIAYTFSRIDATNPDVVMLEEVCQAQLEALKARYPTWSVLFAPMTTNENDPDKCGGTPKGQVLASRRAMTEEIRQDLGEALTGKYFTLLCGEVPMPNTQRKVLACVTHLRATFNDPVGNEAARDKQVWRIANTLNPRVKNGQAVVVGGDFNAGPGNASLDHLYRLTRWGNTTGGEFDEADQTDPNREKYVSRDEVRCAPNECRTGEGTMTNNKAKLDHVFFSHNRIVDGQIGAEVDGSGGSGHKLYRAFAKLNL